MKVWMRARLLAASGAARLLGTRVDWGARSQGAALPAIVLHQISGTPGQHSTAPDGWTRSRVQIDCWGRTFADAEAAADIAQAAFLRCRETTQTVKFRTFVIDRASDDDRDEAGILHRVRLDVIVWHTT